MTSKIKWWNKKHTIFDFSIRFPKGYSTYVHFLLVARYVKFNFTIRKNKGCFFLFILPFWRFTFIVRTLKL